MSPPPLPNASDCQTAAELLERLESSSRQVRNGDMAAVAFYKLAEQVVAEVTGKQGRFCVDSSAASIPLGEHDAIADPIELARYQLTGDEAIMLKVSVVDGGDLAPWQHSFVDAVLDCTATVYLKEHYHRRTDRTAGRCTSKDTRWKRRWWIAVAMAAVLFVPVPFRLAVEGSVMPIELVGVFSPSAGTLISIEVDDSQSVQTGDILARIESPEIELQQDRLRGELLTAQTELSSIRMSSGRAASLETNYPRSERWGSPSTQTAVLRARIASLERQVELIERVHASLTLRATRPGCVVIGDAQSALVGQHLMQSQWLMSVVDQTAGCQAIVDLPSQAYGYLVAKDSVNSPRSTATLRLRSDPARTLTGQVSEIGTTVFYNQAGEGVIPVTISLEPNERSLSLEEFRMGAPVVGHLSLGSRSLGFVCFRPVIEVIRSWGW